MGLFLGDSEPSKIFLGDTPISKVFLGDTQIRPSGSDPSITYSSFDAYNIRDARMETYEETEQIDLMEVEGQQQTITEGGVTISEKYLALGIGYDMGGTYGGGEVIVAFKTNENADLLAYVIKTESELGYDFYTYREAFMGGEMTDEIWNTVQSWVNPELNVSTSDGITTISDGSQSILVDVSNHNMIYNADYYAWSSDTTTEYATLQSNGWLVDGTYEVGQDWETIVNSLKTKCISNATISHNTTIGEITIQNGNRSITLADRNVGATKYYGETGSTAEEFCGDYTTYNNASCPSGYHFPTCSEFKELFSFYKTIHPNNTISQFADDLLIPMAGYNVQQYGDGYTNLWLDGGNIFGIDLRYGYDPDCMSISPSATCPTRPFKNI